MADKFFTVGDNQIVKRFKDMGDGTHAEVLAVSVTSQSTPAPTTVTPTTTTVTTGGTIAAGAHSIMFFPTSGATATAAGRALTPNTLTTFDAPSGTTYGAIAYSVTGGNLTITVER